MNFEQFQKAFFPSRCPGSEEEVPEEDFKLEDTMDHKSKEDVLVQRMLKIEKVLEDKFSSNFVSIRKAFLHLDIDYDGFITAEDIARQFSRDDQKLDFRDLRMLIKNRDSKRSGKINFKDF